MWFLSDFQIRSRQLGRFSRLGLNLFAGSAFISACYRFPALSGIKEQSLNDYRLFNLWVADLAKSMNSQVHVSGEMMQENGIFVSNHISWLDTIIFNHLRPLSFVARHDLEYWPLLGTFTKRMESIYIDRTNKFQAYRSIPNIESKLLEGRSVHLFPESTTSDGQEVLPFFPMFYEAAVRVGVRVQPVVLRYSDGFGNFIPEPAFIDDDSFLDTLERILRIERVHAHVHYCEPLDARKVGRKELCKVSRQMIVEQLEIMNND